MTPQDVAPILGLTSNGVAALAYRAREGLRTAWLQAHVSDPGATADCRGRSARSISLRGSRGSCRNHRNIRTGSRGSARGNGRFWRRCRCSPATDGGERTAFVDALRDATGGNSWSSDDPACGEWRHERWGRT